MTRRAVAESTSHSVTRRAASPFPLQVRIGTSPFCGLPRGGSHPEPMDSP